MTRERVIEILQGFLSGSGSDWDWNELLLTNFDDRKLEAVRSVCFEIHDAFPAHKPDAYCNERGLEVVQLLVHQLATEEDFLET